MRTGLFSKVQMAKARAVSYAALDALDRVLDSPSCARLRPALRLRGF
jgi:hypothetical protein